MDMQKYADEIKSKPNKMLKVFPSGKKIVAGLALGAATMALGGTPMTSDVIDNPGAKSIDLNVVHTVGLLAMTAAGAVAMKEGLDYISSESKAETKTKKLSPEEIKAAMSSRSI